MATAKINPATEPVTEVRVIAPGKSETVTLEVSREEAALVRELLGGTRGNLGYPLFHALNALRLPQTRSLDEFTSGVNTDTVVL